MNQKRKYTCRVCRSHNVINYVKGHKYKCPFLHCYCEICNIKSKNVNTKMSATVDSVAMEEPSICSTPMEVQRFTILVPKGEILFLQNSSNSITVDGYIYNGIALLQGKFH